MAKKEKEIPTSFHVGVAAEAFAAAQFARLGYDVSVQYGANQPEYDLIISSKEKLLKVSVKGSQDGSWGLTQNRLVSADYHKAADEWLEEHNRKTILCFVQFEGTSIEQMPRIYLATPSEVVVRLKETANNRGDTILYEYKAWTERAAGAGTVDRIPETWKFTNKRILQLIDELII